MITEQVSVEDAAELRIDDAEEAASARLTLT